MNYKHTTMKAVSKKYVSKMVDKTVCNVKMCHASNTPLHAKTAVAS